MGDCSFYRQWGKRAFDLAMSIAGLVMFAPSLTIISLVILILDGRPILFRQERVGRRRRLFSICKFRTMKNGASSASAISIAGDSRVTHVGRWLRQFKLDELPQLWNVLRGEMSFVGPRPDVPGYLDQLGGEASELWELRPGITGPATLLFRREEDLLGSVTDYSRFNDEVIYPEKVRLNLMYLRQSSFARDLGYILATIAPGPCQLLGIDRVLRLDHESFASRMRDLAQDYIAS